MGAEPDSIRVAHELQEVERAIARAGGPSEQTPPEQITFVVAFISLRWIYLLSFCSFFVGESQKMQFQHQLQLPLITVRINLFLY